jgi:UDP-N-acetylmuramate dehydrogenase
MSARTLQPTDLRRLDGLGLTLREEVPLATLTTMKVGGAARYFVTVSTMEQMRRLVRWAHGAELPYFVLGGGSNILISDAGIDGLVIHNRCREVRVDEAPCCVWPFDDRPYLFAESGAPTAGAARFSVNAGLSGFEWAISVPGTIGGCVLGNAGAHGGEAKDNFEYGYLLDETAEFVEFKAADMDYAYRDSSLKRRRPLRAAFKPVILCANFRLERGDPAALRARADQFLQHRRRTQPTEPSLGSTFVNPPGDFAGRLIEAAGLKGAGLKGAGLQGAGLKSAGQDRVAVSSLHANFIVNPGGVGAATAADVVALVRHIRATVAERFGITLITEIQLAGEWQDVDDLLEPPPSADLLAAPQDAASVEN